MFKSLQTNPLFWELTPGLSGVTVALQSFSLLKGSHQSAAQPSRQHPALLQRHLVSQPFQDRGVHPRIRLLPKRWGLAGDGGEQGGWTGNAFPGWEYSTSSTKSSSLG